MRKRENRVPVLCTVSWCLSIRGKYYKMLLHYLTNCIPQLRFSRLLLFGTAVKGFPFMDTPLDFISHYFIFQPNASFLGTLFLLYSHPLFFFSSCQCELGLVSWRGRKNKIIIKYVTITRRTPKRLNLRYNIYGCFNKLKGNLNS